MEKSLIIYGKNPGIVSAISLGVMNLISPFLWEGIFIPLVPDIARELFGAPVPLIIGTISPPRLSDVSAATAILHLNDDAVQAKLLFSLSPVTTGGGSGTDKESVAKGSTAEISSLGVKIPSMAQKRKKSMVFSASSGGNTNLASPSVATTSSTDRMTTHHSSFGIPTSASSSSSSLTELLQHHTINVHIQEIDFLAWFTRLPEVVADLPIPDEMSRRIQHLRKLFCRYILPHLHYVYDILLYDPKSIAQEFEQRYGSSFSTGSFNNNKEGAAAGVFPPGQGHYDASSPLYLKTIEKTIRIKNTADHFLLSHHLPLSILHEITIVLIRLKEYNYHFVKEMLEGSSSSFSSVLKEPDWKRFLKKNEVTEVEEFYPQVLMEPIRNRMEFQDAMVHTQMFISFLDRLRKESRMLNRFR